MEDWQIDEELGLNGNLSSEEEEKSDVSTNKTKKVHSNEEPRPIVALPAVTKPVIGYTIEPIQLLPPQIRYKVQNEFDALYVIFSSLC